MSATSGIAMSSYFQSSLEGMVAAQRQLGAEAIAVPMLMLRNQQLDSVTQAFRTMHQLTLAPIIEAQKAIGSLYDGIRASVRMTEQSLAALRLAANNPIFRLAERPPLVLEQIAKQLAGEAEESGDTQEIEAASVTVGAATFGTTLIQHATIGVLQSVSTDDLVGLPASADLSPMNLTRLIAGEIQYRIRSDPNQVDNPDLYKQSRFIGVANALCEVAYGVIRCNSLRPEPGKLFKYTDASVQALLHLSQFFAVTKQAFCEIVKCLYFVLYEGAGSKHLRFLEENLVTEDEAQVVFDIKQFRNYYCYHDIEHGEASNIRKKKAKLSALFERYIGVPLPSKPEHFGGILIKLIQRVGHFLQLITQRLEQKYGSEG